MPNNALFFINSEQPIVSFYLAGVMYFGNKHRKLFVVMTTIIFNCTIPIIRDLDSILDRSKIFTHTPKREQMDKKRYDPKLESFYSTFIPPRVEQVQIWIKSVFGIYAEAIVESTDENCKVYEEAIYRIGYTLYTSGENLEEITAYDDMIAKGFVSMFYEHICSLYGNPKIDSFGSLLFMESSRQTKLSLINTFKNALLKELEEFKTHSTQTMKVETELSPIKQKSVALLSPTCKTQLKKRYTEGNLLKQEQKDKIKIYLNGKKMTHLQSCRFFGEDYFGSKQYIAKSNSTAEKLMKMAPMQGDELSEEYGKLSAMTKTYLLYSILNMYKLPLNDYKAAEAILFLKQDSLKFTDADRKTLILSTSQAIHKIEQLY